MPNVKAKAWISSVVSFAVMAAAIFLPAGTIDYWRAWVLAAVVAMTNIPLTRLVTKTPRLLEARKKAGPRAERRSVQKLIMTLAGLSFMAAFVVSGLDRRFHWSHVPLWLALVGDLLVALGMGMLYRVFKENSFASATIGIAGDQKVIATGPYAVIRHPMYSGVTAYTIGMPLALGSYWGLFASVLVVLIIVWRLFDEEDVLVSGLPAYREYCATVRWRLVPGIF